MQSVTHLKSIGWINTTVKVGDMLGSERRSVDPLSDYFGGGYCRRHERYADPAFGYSYHPEYKKVDEYMCNENLKTYDYLIDASKEIKPK
jgi:hypothetical protein